MMKHYMRSNNKIDTVIHSYTNRWDVKFPIKAKLRYYLLNLRWENAKSNMHTHMCARPRVYAYYLQYWNIVFIHVLFHEFSDLSLKVYIGWLHYRLAVYFLYIFVAVFRFIVFTICIFYMLPSQWFRVSLWFHSPNFNICSLGLKTMLHFSQNRDK